MKHKNSSAVQEEYPERLFTGTNEDYNANNRSVIQEYPERLLTRNEDYNVNNRSGI